MEKTRKLLNQKTFPFLRFSYDTTFNIGDINVSIMIAPFPGNRNGTASQQCAPKKEASWDVTYNVTSAKIGSTKMMKSGKQTPMMLSCFAKSIKMMQFK